jgi:iron complex transport system substrate-binding protein
MRRLWLVLAVFECSLALAGRVGLAKSTHIDALGAEVAVPAHPERIISLSPNLTEMLFAIGVQKGRIVGITRYCNFPPETQGIEIVGGIVDPSVEGILRLRPDLVLATRGNPVTVIGGLRTAGVPVYAFESQGGLTTVAETLQRMVELTAPDDTAKAGDALRRFRHGLECMQGFRETLRSDQCPTVYYYDPVSPDWTAGPGTHISEAISLAGGRNVGDDAAMAWPRYGTESLLARQPDWILVAASGVDTGATARDTILSAMRTRAGWMGLAAVRNGRLCLVPGDWLLRPGPRVIPALERLSRCLHPDRNPGCEP